MNVLVVTVQASVQNTDIDSKQKSIIRKWKENKKYIESMIESFQDAERKIEDFTDQLKETGDEYEQVDEYIKCSNERLEVQNRLKLLTEFVNTIESEEHEYQIYLNKSKILKDCFNSELLGIEKMISDYPEENCLEFIPHNDTNEVINFGDIGYLNSLIDSRIINIYGINRMSFENKCLSEIAKEISHQSKTLNKRNVLIKKEHNEVDAVQHETILNHTHSSITKNSLFEVNKRNVLIKKEHNEVDAVQHETILNHTQSSITENSSFEGNFYLIYLVIIILSAVFLTGAVYVLCTYAKFVRFNLK
uniref:t-SNARE coiled-coil homology domain-containing protein n=1 Tax=Schistosoma mansoni TaxID=6183 RepID=A0A5K4FD84_SCHMA